ncbi:alpha/beta fold hydrolase [Clostridium sp. C2-6-12]|uniref:alpha/beta fold hydrolase n=1 Tax=Clostridium sp. C2-6-12 TaxID=2698832 RepID=UPI00136F25E4|nr:alpha/beta fold hydrolase [Clostridium sp. C2-6-12]
MKLLAHSNVVHKLEKDKVSKRKILKKIVIFFVALFLVGVVAQIITNFIDGERLKSRFKYGRIDGKKMEYKFKSGTDYTVVFDGALGNNMYEWENICKTLEDKKMSTFIYNRRGYGFNDGGEVRTPEDQAKDLKLLLRKAGVSEPYVLVGEEYGSLVITNFIKLYPKSVAGVILVDPMSEEVIKTNEFKESIKSKYYRSKFETIGTNFSLTSLLSSMGLTTENKVFKEHLGENELNEFVGFENKKNYKEAVSNELRNLYEGSSDSQKDGLFEAMPFYLITSNENDPAIKLGEAALTTLYKKESSDSPVSLLDPDTIVNGINNVMKEAKKLSNKKS